MKAAVAINKALQAEELVVSLKAVDARTPTPPAAEPRRQPTPRSADAARRMPIDIRSVALTVLAVLGDRR